MFKMTYEIPKDFPRHSRRCADLSAHTRKKISDPRKLRNQSEISKLGGDTCHRPAPLQKLILGNNSQNSCKSRYQSSLVFSNFAPYLVKWFSVDGY